MSEIIFTEEQNLLLDALASWLQNPDPNLKAANLAAYAGCGKTTVLARFVSQLKEKALVVAPTHAALSQLQLRLCPADNPHIEFKTVASALKQVPFQSNTSVELTFFTAGGNYDLKQFALIIVDESSMLSESEVKTFIEKSEKVIFLGDMGQLAPVKKKPAVNLLNAIATQFCLTKVLRSNDVIAQEAIKARTIPQYIPQSTSCKSIMCHENEEALLKAFYQRISSKEMAIGSVVWISRTNKEIHAVNAEAHKLLTGRQDSLVAGDYIRLGQNCLLGKNNTIVQIESAIAVSEDCFTIATKPAKDGTEVKATVALPKAYAKIEKSIALLVELFKQDKGSEVYENELSALRAIVPVDFTYAITVHKSQGSSIAEVYANSQRLFSSKAFYVAYSRAAQQLNCCNKVYKTKGHKALNPEDLAEESMTWVNKHSGLTVTLPTAEALNPGTIRAAIVAQCSENVPSISHIQCVLNPHHAAKSAKGWMITITRD